MTVFRLSPINPDDSIWRDLAIADVVLTDAPDEDTARRRVAGQNLIASRRLMRTKPIAHSPWLFSVASTCSVVFDQASLPAGQVVWAQDYSA